MLSQLLDGQPDGTLSFPADWGQGRSTFGGVVAGAAVRAMTRSVSDERPLRFLQTVFVGPVPPGDAQVSTSTLRVGGSATLCEARVSAQGSVRTTLSAVYGQDRESRILEPAPSCPAMPPPDGLKRFPYIEGVTPAFTKRVDLAMSEGGLPYTATPASAIAGWIRFPQATGVRDPAVIACLLDAWPAPVLQQLVTPRPASSVAWTIHFNDGAAGLASDWCRFRASCDVAERGYHTFHSRLWDADGVPLAGSTQHVAIFG